MACSINEQIIPKRDQSVKKLISIFEEKFKDKAVTGRQKEYDEISKEDKQLRDTSINTPTIVKQTTINYNTTIIGETVNVGIGQTKESDIDSGFVLANETPSGDSNEEHNFKTSHVEKKLDEFKGADGVILRNKREQIQMKFRIDLKICGGTILFKL
ncbi:unnamed protein product [Owenia fusiformis]|uniref:Uncharacterized protein n=1 Tax=Owenia fusiformis TaxID=6347 RepID=A0A8S4N1J9_OWEFU|nr:unnamed protein product [Owenia fusiformis]